MPRITLYGMYQYDPSLFDGIILPDGISKEFAVDEIMKRSGMLYPYHQSPPMLKHNISQWFSRNYHDFLQVEKAFNGEYNPLENYHRYNEATDTISNRGTDSFTDRRSLHEKVNNQSDLSTTATSNEGTERTGTGKSESSGNENTLRNGNNNSLTGVTSFESDAFKDKERRTDTVSENVNGNKSETQNTSQNENIHVLQTQDGNTVNTENTEATTTETKENQTVYGKITEQKTSTYEHGNIGVQTVQSMIKEEIELRLQYDMYMIIAEQFEHEFLIQVY